MKMLKKTVPKSEAFYLNQGVLKYKTWCRQSFLTGSDEVWLGAEYVKAKDSFVYKSNQESVYHNISWSSNVYGMSSDGVGRFVLDLDRAGLCVSLQGKHWYYNMECTRTYRNMFLLCQKD